MSIQSFILWCLFFFLSSSFTEAAPGNALITHLPGFNGNFPSKHYSGYVKIDEKSLFYYFVVSERNPNEDPVVLWLNGGPGCSSFDGFVYEHGPFNFEKPKTYGSLPKLQLNPYSWSKVSNIIYLDSPAGVGLSYSDNQEDYKTGDLRTSLEMHTFLLKWFEQYPEFLSKPIFHLWRVLCWDICLEAGIKPVLNFKGYMIGNAATDWEFDGNSLVPFAHGMGLIPDVLFEEVTTACNGTFYGNDNPRCKEKLEKVHDDISGLNKYNILEPCYHRPEEKEIENGYIRLPSSFRRLGETERPLPVRKRIFGRVWPLGAPVRDGIVPTWPQLLKSKNLPCTDDEVANARLNNEAVRKAIHAREENLIWEIFTDKILYNHDLGSMVKYRRNLTAWGYRALIFRYPHLVTLVIMICVPYIGREKWTRSLGYKILDVRMETLPMNSVTTVIFFPFCLRFFRYLQGYDNNLTFLAIKGAGHTVPEYKPQEALAFYSRWLAGDKI
ncbi:hypothetical protein MKW98_025217 [Papaver atlanticum]|uniref:Uncharacterized protein n=1 Tax=Papaver atlanticum TaxID=357466 RepID=A0AAD4S1N5_9MAGN|nr:hypothetical protein MKW98_025217 [Papaver atlanticum]